MSLGEVTTEICFRRYDRRDTRVVNEESRQSSADVADYIKAAADLYGVHRNKLKLIDGSSFIGKNDLIGWRRQQVFKLTSYRHLDGENIVILDAKNHFVRPIELEDFFQTTAGRPKTYTRVRRQGQVQYKWLRDSLKALDANQRYVQLPATPTTTPFPVTKSLLEELEAYVDKRFGSYEALFGLPDISPTEFFLISSFVYKSFGSLDKYFSPDLVSPITLFDVVPDKVNALRLIQEAQEASSHTFSVYARRVNFMDGEERSAIARLWVDLGLASFEEAKDILFAGVRKASGIGENSVSD